jgi:molybdate transport system ATP-binding protein
LLKVDVHKKFIGRRRNAEVSFTYDFPQEGVFGVYGASGIGKSTALRMIAGLTKPDKGSVLFNEQTWFDHETSKDLPVAERKVGYVFQDYNLFPNMTVQENLLYASPDGLITPEISDLLLATQLDNLLESRPNELSGGQKQRLAILRSLASQPNLLLLDEPFSALDDESIATFIEAVKKIKENTALLTIMVSHRRDVLAAMCDKILHYSGQGELVSYTPEQMKNKSSDLLG